MPYYVGGDYYPRGDYYRGDIFGTIFGGLKKVAGAAVGGAAGFLSGGPLGALKGAAQGAGLLPKATVLPAPTMIPSFGPPMQQVPVPGLKGTVQRILPGGATGYYTRRRMNPLNVKALRRASRRTDMFVRTARKALKHTAFTIVTRSSRRGGSPGVITKREASAALRR